MQKTNNYFCETSEIWREKEWGQKINSVVVRKGNIRCAIG